MKTKHIDDSLCETEIKRKWLVGSFTPETVDELKFTSRAPDNGIRWWDITPPNTDYYHVHEYLGRAYAFEFLDLIHNPDKKARKKVYKHTLKFIVSDMMRKQEKAPDLVWEGFFDVISEFLIKGKVPR
jgi:hypothetical protein